LDFLKYRNEFSECFRKIENVGIRLKFSESIGRDHVSRWIASHNGTHHRAFDVSSSFAYLATQPAVHHEAAADANDAAISSDGAP
jgi:hypothetical protein